MLNRLRWMMMVFLASVFLMPSFTLMALAVNKKFIIAPMAIPKTPYSGNIVNGVPVGTGLGYNEMSVYYQDTWAPFYETASYNRFIVDATVVDYTFAQWPLGPTVPGGYWLSEQNDGPTSAAAGEMLGSPEKFADGFWTPGERYIDLDENGKYTSMEAWWDTKTNTYGGNTKNYDSFGEEFVDYDGDGLFSGNVTLIVYAQDLDNGLNGDVAAGDFYIGNPSANILANKQITISEFDFNFGGNINSTANTFVTTYNGDLMHDEYRADSAGNIGGSKTATNTPPNGGFDIPKNSSGPLWSLLQVAGSVSYKVLEGGVLVTKTAIKYRSPEYFFDKNNDNKWNDRDTFEDFMIRWEPWYSPDGGTTITGGWVPVTQEYIINNYPGGNVAGVWARTNNGIYDEQDPFSDIYNEKIMITYDDTLTVQFGPWDPHGWAPAIGAGNPGKINGWFNAMFGGILVGGGSSSKWLTSGDFGKNWLASPFNLSRGGLINPQSPGFDTTWLSHCPGENSANWTGGANYNQYKPMKTFGVTYTGANVMPDSTGAYYDGPREFRDLPSSIYHAGGDLRFSEETDPTSTSINGTDKGSGLNPDTVFADQKIEVSGPLAYNIHGDKGADAGTQVILELLTWNTEGSATRSTDDVISGWNSYDSLHRRCRDNNLDGLIDQGVCPPKGFNNYLSENVTLKTDGTGVAGYPFCRERLMEDALEYNDDGLDYDQFTSGTNPLVIDYLVMAIPPQYQAGKFQGLAPLNWSIHTRDNTTAYNTGGQPDQDPARGYTSCHESIHQFWGAIDYYDYDRFNGIRANNPIGSTFEIMAAGPLVATPLIKTPFVTYRNLRTILVPGQEQTINVYPHDYITNDDQYYQFGTSGSDGESFLFYYDSGVSTYSSGFQGLQIIHVAGSTSEGAPAQQRIGSHYSYEFVEADGRKDMVEGASQGDITSVWPYNGKVTFNTSSYPKSEWWDGKDSGIEIRNMVLPSTPTGPMKVTFYMKDDLLPKLSFINPPGGTSNGTKYTVGYKSFDIYGGSKIYFFRDTAQSGYGGTYISNINKNTSGDVTSAFEANMAGLPNGGYRFYAFVEPGTGEDGTNLGYYVAHKLTLGNGTLTVNTVNCYSPSIVGNVLQNPTSHSTQQVFTLECVTTGTATAQFKVTGSVTGLEPTLATVGTPYTTTNNYSGLTITINNGTTNFSTGDTFYVFTSGLTQYSESILVVDGQVYLEDSAVPGLILTALTNNVNEGARTATFTVKLSTKPAADVTVTVFSQDTTEATVSPSTLIFTPEQTDGQAYWISQTVTVTGVNDTIIDGDMNFAIGFTMASTDTNYSGTSASTVTGVNVDDELYGFNYQPGDRYTYESDNGTTVGEKIWVSLKSRPTGDVVVSLSTDDATEGVILGASTMTFTTQNWNSLQSFTVSGNQDTIIDADVAYNVVFDLVSIDDHFNGSHILYALTNIDDDIPNIIVSKMSNDLQESGITGTFNVRLSSAPATGTTVVLPILTHDASVAITDIKSIIFDANNYNTPQLVTVIPVEDISSAPRVVDIDLGALVSGDSEYSGLQASPVVVTVLDNDSAGYTISKPENMPNENGRSADFYIHLNSAPSSDVVLTLNLNDLTEATVSPSTITFNPTNWKGRQWITVTGIDDVIVDGDTPFKLDFSVATTSAYSSLIPTSVDLVNIDNDQPQVVYNILDRFSDENGDFASFTAYLSKTPAASETINLSLSSLDTTEGVFSGGNVLSFTANNFNVPQTVFVTGKSDSLDDGNVGYSVSSNVISGNTDYQALRLGNLSLVNRSGNVAALIMSSVSGATSESGSTATFKVRLQRAPTDPVTVTITSSSNTEATVTPTLTFTANNYLSPQTVTITGVDDSVIDGDVPYFLSFAVSSLSDANYNGLKVPQMRFFNKDNDSKGLNVNVTDSESSESGGTATVKFSLFQAPTATVLLYVNGSDDTEGTLSTNVFYFTTSAWSTSKTLTVTGNNDLINDGDMPYYLNLRLESADPAYNNIFVQRVNLTNIDDDNPKLIVTNSAGTEVASTFSMNEGSSANLIVHLQTQPLVPSKVFIDVSFIGTTSSVNLSLNNGVTQSTNLLLEFDDSTYGTNQTMTLMSAEDSVYDNDQTFVLTWSVNTLTTDTTGYELLNIPSLEVIELDNDTPGITVTLSDNSTSEAGGSGNFTVVLNSIPSASVRVSFANSDTTEVSLGVSFIDFAADATALVPQMVSLTGVDDSVDDGDQIAIISFTVGSGDDNYDTLDTMPGITPLSITNVDNDTKNVIVGTLASITEGDSKPFTVVLGSEPTADVTVAMSVGSLLNSLSSLTFTSANWATPQTVTVQSIENGVAVGGVITDSITFTITSADANYNAFALATNPKIVTIIEDDSNSFRLDGLAKSLYEDGDTTVARVRLGSEWTSSNNVVIDVTSSDNSKLMVLNSPLSLGLDTWASGKQIKLQGVKDADITDDSITITLSENTTLSALYGAAPSFGSITALDRDRVGLIVTAADNVVDENGGSTLFIALRLNKSPSSGQTVTVTPNNANLTLAPSTLMFNDVNYAGLQYLSIRSTNAIVSDTVEALAFAISTTGGTVSGYETFSPDNFLVRIRDLNSPHLTVTRTGAVTNEDLSTQTVSVALSSAPTATVTVSLSLSDSEEASLDKSSLTFTTANYAVAQAVTVTGKNDSDKDGPMDYTLTLTAANGGYTGLSESLLFTNLDNDSAEIWITAESEVGTSEMGSVATKSITLKLATTPAEAVTLPVSSSNTAEGTVSTSLITLDGANGYKKTITVTGVDDALADRHQMYRVVLGETTSLDPKYSGLVLSDVSVINFDDETAGLLISYPSTNLITMALSDVLLRTKELSGNVSTDTFKVTLPTAPTGNVVLNIASTDTTEGIVSPSQIVLDASGSWSTGQVVSVTGQKIGASDDANYNITLTMDASTQDPVYKKLPVFSIAAFNESVNLSINDSPDLVAAGGEFVADRLTTSTLVLTASKGLMPYTWSVNVAPGGNDLSTSVSTIAETNDTLTISLGNVTGSYQILVGDSQTTTEYETYKFYLAGSPSIIPNAFKRPTVNTLSIYFNVVPNLDRRYFVYHSLDGISWSLLNATPVNVNGGLPKPRYAAASQEVFVTVPYEGSLGGYFQLVATDSTGTVVPPELPTGSGVYYNPIPPENTTTDKALNGASSGGGGGCLLK